MYCVLSAEPLVYQNKIIRGHVACCVLYVENRALGVSDHDYPRVSGLLCTFGEGRALGAYNQDYPRVGGMQCIVCWRQSPWCT